MRSIDVTIRGHNPRYPSRDLKGMRLVKFDEHSLEAENAWGVSVTMHPWSARELAPLVAMMDRVHLSRFVPTHEDEGVRCLLMVDVGSTQLAVHAGQWLWEQFATDYPFLADRVTMDAEPRDLSETIAAARAAVVTS